MANDLRPIDRGTTRGARSDERFQTRYGPWALITGASSGIGRAIAAQVAARGINVALAARNRQELQAIARDLRDAHHVETIVIAVDLVDPGAASHLEDQLSDLDVGLVVLAAGFGTIGAFADAPLDRELEMIAVNITAVTRLAHTFARRLVIRGRGAIVEMTMNSATTPEVVARTALAGLGRRMTVVPGWRGKFLTAALAMLPRRLRIRVLALVIRGMRNPPALAAD